MTDVEVHIDLEGQVRRLGLLRRQVSRRGEIVTFEYDATWLEDPNRFSIEPALTLSAGTFPPQAGQAIFGSFGDSAPDTWGRRLPIAVANMSGAITATLRKAIPRDFSGVHLALHTPGINSCAFGKREKNIAPQEIVCDNATEYQSSIF